MKPAAAPASRFRTAIALSIAGHACALWLLCALLSGHRLTPGEPNAVQSPITVTRIMYRASIISRPTAVAVAPRTTVPEPTVPEPTVPEPPVPRVRPTALPAVLKTIPVSVRRRARAPRTLQPRRDSGKPNPTRPAPGPRALAITAPVPIPAAAETVVSAVPAPSPATTATPAPSATPVRAADAAVRGLFSENYPPALLAPDVISAVRSHIGGHIHVRISVDESGHATDVRFIEPLADPALGERLRATLLAVEYVPADCNGLHCDGILEIAY